MWCRRGRIIEKTELACDHYFLLLLGEQQQEAAENAIEVAKTKRRGSKKAS